MMKKVLINQRDRCEGIGEIPNTLLHYIKRALIIFVLIVTICSLIPIRVLLASDHRTGEYLKAWVIKQGEKFDVEYTHSVQLTPVIEIYSVDQEDNILLEESYFYSYGAGLPSTTPYDFEITKKGFRIYNINEIMDNLIYRTGGVRAEHRINISGKTYPFLDFSKARTGVKFTVKKLSLLSYIAKEVSR